MGIENATLERKMMAYIEKAEQKRALNDEMEYLLGEVSALASELNNKRQHVTEFSDTHMVVMEKGEKPKTVLNKEGLAEHLRAEKVSWVSKKEYLIEQVQKGKLTLDEYSRYLETDMESFVTVKKRKKKKSEMGEKKQ